MNDHYDRLENRTPAARESALFRDLRHVLSIARSRAPALRAQLKGIDPADLTTRADLARIPIRRASELLALQAEAPPFGGLTAARLGTVCHAFSTPGGLLSIAGPAKDWWGMGRAFFAAGLRKGTPMFNCFPYDLSPLGNMAETGARAIGCPIIPAGNADLDRKADAVARLRPRFFCGGSDHLKLLLDHGDAIGADMSSIEAALVTGFSKPGLRHEFHLRKVHVRHALVIPEIGPVAFEAGTRDGLLVNEGMIVEIVDPATSIPVAAGDEGELVITRLNPDYPLLRYATGLRSAQLLLPSSCGRTNVRLAVPREMRPDCVELGDACVHIAHIREIAARHPEAGRMRAYTRRPRDRDELVLKVEVEHGGDASALNERLRETLHVVTRVAGTIEMVRPGTLADDDSVLVDERPLN